jgi:spore germination cell wall hydrolase CwlJ-like protein
MSWIFKILLGINLFLLMGTASQAPIIDNNYKLISNIDNNQLNCLAQNVYYEAATESFEGKLAVAQVTLNRVNSGKFGKTICKTVYQKTNKTCQFSWVCLNKTRVMRYDSKEFIDSKEAAYRIFVSGYRIKKLEDALYYHAVYVNPRWNKKVTAKIGRHIFYA